MRKHKFEVKVNNKVVFQKEDQTWTAYGEAKDKMMSELYQALGGWQKLNAATPGQGGSVNITVSWESTFNRRAPARPKHVIAAEKATRAAKVKEKKDREAEWKKEQEAEIVRLRQRIRHQVDHAFALGKTGTEPAAKYITCEDCNAPAAFLSLCSPLARGVAVVDEDTIVGAVCSKHSKWANPNQHRIPCSRLEFFYDGIRQIAVKP